MEFTVVIGDYSGDGHNITETFTIIVPDNVTEEKMAENYTNNVFGFKFSPTDLGDNLTPNQYDTLTKRDFQWADEHGDVDDYRSFREWIDEDEMSLTTNLYLKITMFFALYGRYDPTNWEIKPAAKCLFGGGTIESQGIGYGAFVY